MLPTPAKLREQSQLYREAARTVADLAQRRRFAACALTLAQVAEASEREGEAGDGAKRAQYERLLAQALDASADPFTAPAAPASLRSAAANYDPLAEQAEAQLSARPSGPADKAG